MEGNNTNALLDVRDLTFSFRTYAGEVQAVRGVSFTLKGQEPGAGGRVGLRQERHRQVHHPPESGEAQGSL